MVEQPLTCKSLVLGEHEKAFIHFFLSRCEYEFRDRYRSFFLRRNDGDYSAVSECFDGCTEGDARRRDSWQLRFQIGVLHLVCGKHLIFALDTAVNSTNSVILDAQRACLVQVITCHGLLPPMNSERCARAAIQQTIIQTARSLAETVPKILV